MSNDAPNIRREALRYQLAGWILFIICALLFIVASIQNDDELILAGSIIFFIACLVFLVPLIKRLRNNGR